MSSFDNIYLKKLEVFFNPYIDYVEKELFVINLKKPEKFGRMKYLEYVVEELKKDDFLVKNTETIEEDGNNLILIPKTQNNTKIKIKFDKDRDLTVFQKIDQILSFSLKNLLNIKRAVIVITTYDYKINENKKTKEKS